ncbi:MAG: DNA polymerase I [Spirochaetia bacterium]|nr:DNA polymerase I [Spirochaetia bacterium]
MANVRKKLYVIDAFGLIYRSYFAFINRPLRDNEGKNVSALYGFYSTLLKIIREYPHDYLVVALDSMTPTFRHQLYKEYKANRDAAPEDLHEQVPRILEILDAANIPHIRVDGWEADDIIASVSRSATELGIDTVMVTGDKDLLQLVTEHITALRPPRKNEKSYREIGLKEVVEEFEIHSNQIVDYLALIGDSSDNVPGVSGIGPKGAVKLLNEYGTLENIYAHIDELTASVATKLRASEENAYLSRTLVRLDDSIPTGIEFETTRFTTESIDFSKAVPFFEKAKATSLIAAIGEVRPEAVSHPSTSGGVRKDGKGIYHCITSIEELKEIFSHISTHALLALDFETTDIDDMKAQPVGFSFTQERNKGYYVPLIAENKPIVDSHQAREALREVLVDKKVRLIGQNIKYDYKVLKRWGIEDANLYFDTMIAAWLIDSAGGIYNLDYLAEKYLDGYRTIKYEDVVAKGESFSDIPLSKAIDYASEDADITYRLYEEFAPMLEKEHLISLFENVEMPVVKILSHMELHGIFLDTSKIDQFNDEVTTRINNIENEVYEEVGHEFNMNSTKQLQEVLFEERALPTGKKNKTGFSTAIDVLEKLALIDVVPRLIVQNRSLVKLKNTYIDVLPMMINSETHRIHTSYTQTGTATGRLSSRNPNLQNIPIKNDDGRRIREAFIPREGYVLLSADYAQIELVVLAHLSDDPTLKEAFINGEDIHTRTASIIFDVHPDLVMSEQRRIAKTINFGVMYGMSAFRLSNELGISRSDASSFIENYFNRLKKVKGFMNELLEEAKKTQSVHTILLRKRPVPQITSSNKMEQAGAERIVINTAIQGSAADIMKLAMIKVDSLMKKHKVKSALSLQVHDELIFEVAKDELDLMKQLVKEGMESAYTLSVPLRVSIETGSCWGEMH